MDTKTIISVITIVVGLATFTINIIWAMSRYEKESLVQSLQQSATSKDKHLRLSAIKYIMNQANRRIFFMSFRTENFLTCVNTLLILWFYETDLVVRRFCELEWDKIAPHLNGKDIDNIVDTIDCFIHDMNETYFNLYIVKKLPDNILPKDLLNHLEQFDIEKIPEGLSLNMNPRDTKMKIYEMKAMIGNEDDEEKVYTMIYQLMALYIHKHITLKRIFTPIKSMVEGRFPEDWHIL